VETNRLRQEAAERAEKVYKVVPRASAVAGLMVSSIFDTIQYARNDYTLNSTEERIEYIRKNLGFSFSKEALSLLLTADSETFNKIQLESSRLTKEIMEREIRPDDVQEARADFQRKMSRYLSTNKYDPAVRELATAVIRPNRIFDPKATEEAQQREMAAVPPQYKQIFVGEVIISKGERVTPAHIDKFTALGLRHPKIDYVAALCISLLTACIVSFVATYLVRYHPTIFASTKLLVLLSLIVVLSVLGLKLGGTMLGLTFSGVQSGYFAMIWIATAGMLTAILLNAQLAILIVALLSTTAGLAMNHELRWALAALLSSLVGIYVVSDIQHRIDLMRAALAVCAANLAMVWLIGRISGDGLRDLLIGSGWAVAGGLGSIMLFWIGAAALERPFGITTRIRLLELSDTNSPILKRLLMEAPGTYSHSIFVGNIAAAAAEAIGADALLVRVAAYYHDIGKMKRPHFFVENQYVENVHDRLNPSLSALVIRSHIKDGVDLAREHGLPPLICDLMSQHHGTSLVRYFYHQATGEELAGSPMLEQQFRYEGQKPQSPEAALLMLADAVEAASRTLAKPTPSQIQDLVNAVVDEKLLDGQLDESGLSFKDISRIKDSFVKSLTSMLHARIEYPELHSMEAKKARVNGSTNKEQPTATSRPETAE
jgi:putative nucleotidyltransferase with HDIG domain